jgi:prevent-host-death family protein
MPTTFNRSRRSRSVIGTFDAKTHFSQLIERVANGEEITITRHDRPVARLVPAERRSQEDVASVFRQMDALRQSLPKSKAKTSLKDLINHGRRF